MALHAVVGRKEMGKTTLGYWMAEQSPKRVIFDPRWRINRGGVTVRRAAHLEDAFAQIPERQAIEINYARPLEDDIGEAFNRFAGHVKRWIELHGESDELVIMVDEISIAKIERSPVFEWCVKCCESERVHFVLTGHRPIDVPTDIRALVNRWYLFQTSLPQDLKVIEEAGGPRLADDVQRLGVRQFIRYDQGQREAIRYVDPSKWYIALRAEDLPFHPRAIDAIDGGENLEGGPLFRQSS